MQVKGSVFRSIILSLQLFSFLSIAALPDCHSLISASQNPSKITLLGATGRVGQAMLGRFLFDPWSRGRTFELSGGRDPKRLSALAARFNQAAIANDIDVKFVATPSYDFISGELIVVAVGADVDPSNPTMTREDLAQKNSPIFEEITQSLLGRKDYKPKAILVVSNPHEFAMHKFRPLVVHDPDLTLLGMGAYLDADRYRKAIADKLEVPVRSVSAFVGGQHGPQLATLPSTVTVNGRRVAESSWNFGVEPTPVVNIVQSAKQKGIHQALDELKRYSPAHRITREPAVHLFAGTGTSAEAAMATVDMIKVFYGEEPQWVSAHTIEENSLPIGRVLSVGNGRVRSVDLTHSLSWDEKFQMQLSRQAIRGSLEVSEPAGDAFEGLFRELLEGQASRQEVLEFLTQHSENGGAPIIELNVEQRERLDQFLMAIPAHAEPTPTWGWISYGDSQSPLYAKPIFGKLGEMGAVLIISPGEPCEIQELSKYLGPPHVHKGAAHISIVMEGEGFFFIETSTPRGRKLLKIPVRKGSVALIPPNAIHTFFTGKGGRFEVLAFTTRMVPTDSPEFRKQVDSTELAELELLNYERSHYPSLRSSVEQALKDQYGDFWIPRHIKYWEQSNDKKIIVHPEVKGLIDLSDPATYKNLPEPPKVGEKPLEALWIVGPGGEVVTASNLWLFRRADGNVVSVPDRNVYWEGANASAYVVLPDGSTELVTNLIGDLGHTTLAAAIPKNKTLAARMAGDFRLVRDAEGNLWLQINSISGRYMDRPPERRVSHAQLDSFADELARLYQIDPKRVTRNWIEGPPASGREVRYHSTPILFTEADLAVAEQQIAELWGGIPTSDSPFWLGVPEIKVNGTSFPRPNSFESLRALSDSILEAVRETPGNSVQFEIDGRTYWLKKNPLGEGGTGFIFKMQDLGLVLKIAKPNAIGIRSMLLERAAAIRIEALAKQNGFSTPKNFYFDPLGLLSIKERIHAPSVAEVLIQEGAVEVRSTPGGVTVHVHPANALRSPKIQAIARQVENLLRVRKMNPDLVLDLAPDNLFVLDTATGGIELSLVDIGPSGPATQKLIDGAQDFGGYLQVAATQIRRNTELGFRPVPPR